MIAAALLALLVAPLTAHPDLAAIAPSAIAPYEPAELVITGSGFDAKSIVWIETATTGKYVRYKPASAEAKRIALRLPLGFGPQPALRNVFIENPDGSKSKLLPLQISKAAVTGGTGTKIEDPNPGRTTPATTQSAEPAPPPASIRELRPAAVIAGKPFTLEVYGEGFADGAKVLVSVNLNAGSSRLPEYQLKPFPTIYHGPDLLEVTFDRGFYGVPGARDVIVQLPDGTRTTAASLRIETEAVPEVKP